MTPQFTTPCFVRIEDMDKRKEVCEKLEQMGYAMNFLPKTLKFRTKNSVIINGRPFYGEYREPSCFLQNYRAGLAKSDGTSGWEFINCGTDIALFLALAGIRSDTDKGQWFIHTKRDNDFVRCEGDEFNYDNFRKASAAEIIEHLKTK